MVISISGSFSKYIHCIFLLQLKDTKDFLCIHNGGNDNSEMVAKLTGKMNDTKISISGNQMFLVFKTNNEIIAKGFNASIMESKFFQENKLSEIRNYQECTL